LLLDRDGRGQTSQRVVLGLLHLAQKLPGVRGKRLDVAALTLRIERVEGERRFPGARDAGEDDQLLLRNVQRDVLEVVLLGASDGNRFGLGHGGEQVRGVLKGKSAITHSAAGFLPFPALSLLLRQLIRAANW